MALALTARLLKSFLYGVSATDPIAFAFIAVLLLAIAIINRQLVNLDRQSESVVGRKEPLPFTLRMLAETEPGPFTCTRK